MKLILRKLFRAAWPMAAVFIFDNTINKYLGVYERWPSFDIPMHVFGGVVTAWCLARLLKSLKVYISLKPSWLRYWFLISGTALVGIVWEFYEWSLDQIFPNMGMQLGLADTLGDLLNDLIGATIFIVFIWYRHRSRSKNI